MKKLNTAKTLFGFLGLATFASLVGTVSGTLAWYSYTTRVTVSYSGTSIENTVQLQIGIASETKMPHVNGDADNEEFWTTMTETTFEGDSTFYYFAPMGVGLSSPLINAYLSANGYGTNLLKPVTSGYYDPTDDNCSFSLKQSPNSIYHKQDIAAPKQDFIELPLVFRVSKSKTLTDEFVSGQELWLTDAKAVASSDADGEVFRAMRIFFNRKDYGYDTNFILNPNALNNVAGETTVGGLLDMTYDKYYDFDNDGEVIYGEWDETILPDPRAALSSSGYVVPDGQENAILDLNNTGHTEADTYCARHYPGAKYYENLNSIPFKTAKYESVASIRPARNSNNGKMSNVDPSNPTSVCITGTSAEHFIGRVDATIWIEGWDHSVVDEEIAHAFDLGLTFEINKVGASS